MTRNAKMTSPKPVVTMDDNESLTLFVDDRPLGLVLVGLTSLHRVFIPNTALNAAELRAIADFLDQLEGADLLSQVTP